MAALKTFNYRTDTYNRVAVKEEYRRQVTHAGIQVDVSFGLTLNGELSPLYVFQENILRPLALENIDNFTRGKGKSALYYMVEDLNYICTMRVIYRNDKPTSKTKIIVYLPQGLDADSKLQCERVTSKFTPGQLARIEANVMAFAIARK